MLLLLKAGRAPGSYFLTLQLGGFPQWWPLSQALQ
jgi:hypothetical protein